MESHCAISCLCCALISVLVALAYFFFWRKSKSFSSNPRLIDVLENCSSFLSFFAVQNKAFSSIYPLATIFEFTFPLICTWRSSYEILWKISQESIMVFVWPSVHFFFLLSTVCNRSTCSYPTPPTVKRLMFFTFETKVIEFLWSTNQRQTKWS